MGLSLFFDTYALIEVSEGAKAYEPYSGEIGVVTTKMNLMEFHYSVLKTLGTEKANNLFNAFAKYVTEITDEDIIEANLFKLKHNKGDLSYVDCLGYAISNRLGIKFLTGDKEFEHLPNVEFVK